MKNFKKHVLITLLLINNAVNAIDKPDLAPLEIPTIIKNIETLDKEINNNSTEDELIAFRKRAKECFEKMRSARPPQELLELYKSYIDVCDKSDLPKVIGKNITYEEYMNYLNNLINQACKTYHYPVKHLNYWRKVKFIKDYENLENSLSTAATSKEQKDTISAYKELQYRMDKVSIIVLEFAGIDFSSVNLSSKSAIRES